MQPDLPAVHEGQQGRTSFRLVEVKGMTTSAHLRLACRASGSGLTSEGWEPRGGLQSRDTLASAPCKAAGGKLGTTASSCPEVEGRSPEVPAGACGRALGHQPNGPAGILPATWVLEGPGAAGTLRHLTLFPRPPSLLPREASSEPPPGLLPGVRLSTLTGGCPLPGHACLPGWAARSCTPRAAVDGGCMLQALRPCCTARRLTTGSGSCAEPPCAPELPAAAGPGLLLPWLPNPPLTAGALRSGPGRTCSCLAAAL